MKNLVSWFHWIPRLLCIAAILFVSMFALDSFAPGLTIWEQIRGLLIHLIPSYILLAALLLAWKWEKLGGIVFMVIGLGFSPFIFFDELPSNRFSRSRNCGCFYDMCSLYHGWCNVHR